MYSPKIRDDLIPLIYQAARGAGVAMTKWVNLALEQALSECTNPQGEQGASIDGLSESSDRREPKRGHD